MRRPDRYEQRARTLAVEAGLDPHGRLKRPGRRSMPVWCTFRDEAQHAGSVKVLHRLRPFAVAMAGDGEFDPFKD